MAVAWGLRRLASLQQTDSRRPPLNVLSQVNPGRGGMDRPYTGNDGNARWADAGYG